MTDRVDRATRSRNMAAIRSKDTAPERFVLDRLERSGFSCEPHPDLTYKPDLIVPLYDVAIYVDGCFWHRHENCAYAALPASESWRAKLAENVDRDRRKRSEARNQGWRVITIWECGTKHCAEHFEEVIDAIEGELSMSEWPPLPPV